MLLINLATIYQGRIPTLRHTQLDAETLARSHLKYVLIGELDTYETCLIRELTNQAHRTIRTSRTRKNAYAKSITTTHKYTPQSHLPQHPLPAIEHTLLPILRLRPSPLPILQLKTHLKIKPANTTLPLHTTILLL